MASQKEERYQVKNAENHKKARQPSAPPALSRPAVFKSVIARVTETSGDPRRNSHFGLLRAGAQRKKVAGRNEPTIHFNCLTEQASDNLQRATTRY